MEDGRPTLQPIPDEQSKQEQLDRMKFRATALLVAAAVLWVIALVLEGRWPGVSYLRATAEAAMIGGVADWFAVTALFRYPLGIPIPHTAIIPSRKDRIGRSLGSFVQNNFLSRPVITAKLRQVDVARKAAAWLANPDHASVVARHASAAVTGVVQVLRDDEVQDLIEQSIVSRVRSTQVAPLLGNVLGLVSAGGRDQELFDSAIRLVARLMNENREALRDKIGRETPWWVPTPVDDKIYQKIVTAVEGTLHEVAADPDHPMRERFHEAVEEFVTKLRSSPDMIAKGEHVKEELLQHPSVRAWSGSLWSDMKESLLRHSNDPDSQFRRRVEKAVTAFGESLQKDEELLEKIDGWAESAALYVVEQYRHEIADLISSTVAAWDPEDTTRKIELQIGKDLQFIRINGTLVGGAVGLLIHVISQLAGR